MVSEMYGVSSEGGAAHLHDNADYNVPRGFEWFRVYSGTGPEVQIDIRID